MRLSALNAIITGANQGLGLAIAEEFIKEGASILICARDQDKLTDAANHLKALATSGQKVYSMKVDVSDEDEVKRFIEFGIKTLKTIHVLINNAGIYGPKGCIADVDSKSWKQAFDVNLFGTFYTCKYILNHMKKNNYGKIINVSGGGSGALPTISAYVTSKTAVIRFTETIAQEYAPYHIDINAIAPGALNTRLLDEVLTAGSDIIDKKFYEKSLKQKKNGGVALSVGARLCVYLASKDSDGITGKLISAVWDPYNDFKNHIDDLKDTDVYTLRRIVPKERGMTWDPNGDK